MSTTLNLTMGRAMLNELRSRAGAARDSLGAHAVQTACAKAEPTGSVFGAWRVRLSPRALAWIERETPDIAAAWPQVFNGIESTGMEPTLAELAARVHRQGADGCELEADVDSNGDTVRVRIRFVGGDALVITTAQFGMRLQWDRQPHRLEQVVGALAGEQRAAARDDARGESDR